MQILVKLAVVVLFGTILAHNAESLEAPKTLNIPLSAYFLEVGEYNDPRPIFDTHNKVLEINQQHYGREVPIKDYAKAVVVEIWSENEWESFDKLVKRESGWDHEAQNPNSTAYGIGQFLNSTWKEIGYTKTNNPYRQVDAMVLYVYNRYETPTEALNFHIKNNYY